MQANPALVASLPLRWLMPRSVLLMSSLILAALAGCARMPNMNARGAGTHRTFQSGFRERFSRGGGGSKVRYDSTLNRGDR